MILNRILVFWLAVIVYAQTCPPTCNGYSVKGTIIPGLPADIVVSIPQSLQFVSRISGINGNSNVVTGGGNEDTYYIQMAINSLSTYGGGTLVIDRACLVGSLQVPSNITLYAPSKSYGFYQIPNAGFPILRNANPTTGSIIDQNINIIGGTYNMNVANQSGSSSGNGDYYQQIIGFYGINNLTIRDITLTTGSTGKALFGYAAIFSNWTNIYIDNVYINNNRINGGGDGLHFVSGSGAIIRNVSGFSTSDFIALNSSDYHGITLPSPNWVLTDGPISNVLIDNIQLQSSWNGIGMLSGNNNITNITVKNLSGTSQNYSISLWNYWGSPYTGGYIDGVTFDNIDLVCTSNFNAGLVVGPVVVIYQSGGSVNVRNVQFSNIKWYGSTTNSPWLWISGSAGVNSLQINNVLINESTVNTNNRAFVNNSGTINHISIRNLDWQRPSGSSPTSSIISNYSTITEDVIQNINAPLVLSTTAP